MIQSLENVVPDGQTNRQTDWQTNDSDFIRRTSNDVECPKY